MSRMSKCVGCVHRMEVRRDFCLCGTVGSVLVCVCVCVLACELVVEIDYQRVVPPVKGGKQMKEAKEADLRRTERGRGIHSHDLLNEQSQVLFSFSFFFFILGRRARKHDLRGESFRERGRQYPGGVKGAGCRKSDATSRSAASSVTSSLRSCAPSQRLARRHTAPKHGCCC